MSDQLCVPFRNEYRSRQFTRSYPASSKNAAVKRNSDSLTKFEKALETSDLFGSSSSNNIKIVIAELEKRRANFMALAYAAETRAKEAEEKFEQVEIRLEQETNQRMAAERRLKEFEEDHLRQTHAVEFERMKTIKAVVAQEETKASLKKAENRIKEVENDATSLTIALAKAFQKREEAEATARAAEEKTQVIESMLLRSDVSAYESMKGQLVFGLLIFANQKKMLDMERKLRDVKENYRKREDDFKNMLHKQDAEQSSRHDTAPLASGKVTSLNMQKSPGAAQWSHVPEQIRFGINPKFLFYGVLVTLLLGVCLGLIAAFLEP